MNDKLTRIVQIKKPLSEKDKDELLKQIIDASSLISKIDNELKDYQKSAKDMMKEQSKIISQCCTKAKMGFALENIECATKYEGNVAKHYDTKTGELIDESAIVTDQQISMINEEDDNGGDNQDD